ncbi:hypothetical protein OBRU01_19510 [Operophtera brumata]|uniref:Uncharacterized protein n=1 Tax=Operophtera brumata TaxID=104452 RepID=A0A0L7KX16_OPEBR|nr:hypothetical protein OBRU01_19510 [Operophtera brumata]
MKLGAGAGWVARRYRVCCARCVTRAVPKQPSDYISAARQPLRCRCWHSPKVNEHSLQQLSALLEAQQSSRRLSLPPLSFYLRQKDMPEGEFKLVKMQLNGSNVRETVIKLLHACEMPTNYVDKIPASLPKHDFREWIYENSVIAKDKYESTRATRDQVRALIDSLCNTYGIKEVKFDDGWNISHIRGSLQSLASLASQHSKAMSNLEVSAIQYCTHLRQLITTVGDFYGRGHKFATSVPDSLTKYEIVVEP